MKSSRPALFEYDSLDSTLNQALRMSKLCELPFAIFARTQTAGRGRAGRVWHSPEGNLYFTAAFDAGGISPSHLGLFTLYAALRLVHRLNRVRGVGGLWLKWPNDIWRGRKKLVGMLAELHTVGGRKILLWAAGINLNTEKFPADIKATSLKLIARRDFRVAALAQTVADESAAAFQAFASGRYEKDFWALWARYDKLTGRKIKFDRDGKTVEGRVMGLAADGSLCVKTAKGIETIRSGEVSLSRYL